MAVVLVAVGFALLNSIHQNRMNQKHIEYVERLGGGVGQKQLFPIRDFFRPKMHRPFTAWGSVETINFPSTSQPTDAEVAPILGYFPSLVNLGLAGTRITDEILKPISMHSKLHTLYLDRTDVTDEGIKTLSKSRSLTQISLSRTKISDESIVHLSQMKQLVVLSVGQTSLTDKSVELLCQMPSLLSLDVSGTQISEEGKRRLKDQIEKVID